MSGVFRLIIPIKQAIITSHDVIVTDLHEIIIREGLVSLVMFSIGVL